jgi:hypothetical protein
MNDITTTVDTHLEAYGETDPVRRADLIAQVWLPDGELIDPPLEGEGHDGIGEMATAVLRGRLVFTRVRASAVSALDPDRVHGLPALGTDPVADYSGLR